MLLLEMPPNTTRRHSRPIPPRTTQDRMQCRSEPVRRRRSATSVSHWIILRFRGIQINTKIQEGCVADRCFPMVETSTTTTMIRRSVAIIPATNGRRRPILRDPSDYNDDNTGPDRQYLPKKDKTSISPVANCTASQTSSNGVDMEWDFAVSPKPTTPTSAAKKKTTTKRTAQSPLKTPAVHNATTDKRRIPLRRRPSRDSIMSNCSPIEEESQETLTGATNKSGSGVSGPMTTSKGTYKTYKDSYDDRHLLIIMTKKRSGHYD
mmetsp:Transcript_2283/g.3613  ORF Transcript_2283/g.3613 Transcript_2283/m.3613 type:complete len:264 (+) Transcript_2283:38-829(+)